MIKITKITKTLVLTTLLASITINAEKAKLADISPEDGKATVQKLQSDWLNQLLSGEDVSHLSGSYAQQIKDISASIPVPRPHKFQRGNNYLQDFDQAISTYQNDVEKLASMDKTTATQKWPNKVAYLQNSQQRVRTAQQKLLKHLHQQKHWLINKTDVHKTSHHKKLQRIEQLIQSTKAQLPAQASETLGKTSLNPFKTIDQWQQFLQQHKQQLNTSVQQTKITQKSSSSEQIRKPQKILRNDSLPYAGRSYSAPVLQYDPEITPSYADENATAGNNEDLTDDVVVQFSPAINQLASDLDYDYIKIVNFVRQNINLQYYAGAMKGADATLRSYAGNDVDQAALLIALLRRSNVPARFVHGVIRQPIEQAMASVGLTQPTQVIDALNKAGIAHQVVIEGGQLRAVHRQYTWVTAYLPYANYRGSSADLSERVWIPIAPAIKGDSYNDTPYRYQEANLNADDLVLDYLQSDINQSPLQFWQTQVQSDLSTNYPDLDYQDLLGRSVYDTTTYALVPSSLPFEVIATTGESTHLSNQYIQSLNIIMGDQGQYLNANILMPEVSGKRLTLSYLPATVDDQNLINQSGGMASVAPYLVDLRPVLKIDGRPVSADNNPMPMGSFADLQLTFNSTAGAETFHRNTLIGNYLNLTITTQSDNYAPDTTAPNQYADEPRAARLMHNLAKLYNRHWKAAETEMAAIMDVALIKPIPALTIISPEYNLIESQGLVTELQFKGMSIDAVTNSVDAISRQLIEQNSYDFYRLSGLQGSFLESQTFENQWAVNAISADKALKVQAQNNPPLLLTPDNYQNQLDASNHPQIVKDQIRSWLQTGKHATLLPTTGTQDSWNGSAWIIHDPENGHSGYFISGIYAGGQTTQSPEDWANSDLYGQLLNPYGEGANNNPQSATDITLIENTNNQVGIVDTELQLPLMVKVTDQFNNPVLQTPVEFNVRNGNITLIGQSPEGDVITSNTSMIAFTDLSGIATLPVRLGKKITLFKNVLINPSDQHLTRIGFALIEARVNTSNGQIQADEFFNVISLPDTPHEIALINCFYKDFNCGNGGKPGSHLRTHANVMHYSVVDQHGNFVSNVPIDIEATQGAKIALKSDCDELSIFAPGCAGAEKSGLSKSYWSTFYVYNGEKFQTDFNITVSNDDLSSKTGQTTMWYPEAQDLFPYYGRMPSGILQKSLFYVGPFGKYEAGPPSSPLDLKRLYFMHPGLDETNDPGANENLVMFKIDENGYDPEDMYNKDIIPEIEPSDPQTSLQLDNSNFDIFSVTLPSSPQLMNVDVDMKWEDKDDNGNVLRKYEASITDYVFAASASITNITPNELIVNDAGFLANPSMVTATIEPPNYFPESATIRFYKDAVIIQETKIDYPDGSNINITFDPNEKINFSSLYEVDVTLNEGTEFEIPSEKTSIQGFSQKIITAVNCGNNDEAFSSQSCGGQVFNKKVISPLKIQTNIDLSDPLVCKDENFDIFLNSDANVNIDLERLDELGGLTGEVINIANGVYPAGSSIIPISAEELGTNRFNVTITSNSLITGDSEVVTGELQSIYEVKDSLLIGHAVVKGVDLADGSMIYSKKDIALPAPGADLEFIHTYSNKERFNLGPLGYGWSHNYMSRVFVGNCGRIYVTGADGGTARFRIVNEDIIPMKGFHSTLVANDDGSFSFYSKNGTHYHYIKRQNRVWWVDYIEDTNGNRLTINLESRAGAPLITSVRDSVGRTLVYNYQLRNFQGRTGEVLVSITGPEGINMTFDYNGLGQLTAANREGDTTKETYSYSQDSSGINANLLSGITDNATGANRSYQYSDKTISLPVDFGLANNIRDKQVNSISESDGGTTTFNYSTSTGFNSGVNINQNGTVTNYVLNQHGSADSITAPNGSKTMTWQIEDEILLLSETDENGRTKTFQYDDNANITKETIGDISRSYTYDAPQTQAPFIKDRVSSYTNWRGVTTTYTNDSKGNKTSESIGGLQTTFTYDSRGLVIGINDFRGNSSILNYDALGQLISQTDPAGNQSQMSWDARGRKTSETDASGNRTSFAYDNSDRITSKTLNDRVWSYGYQQGGLIKTETDPNGNPTVYSYDTMGRLLNIKNAAEDNFSYTYDENGNKLTENDFNGNQTAYVYDTANRLISKTEPLGKITTYTYDAVGNVLTESTADRQASYAYDPKRYFLTAFTGEGAPEDGGNKASNASNKNNKMASSAQTVAHCRWRR